MPPLPLDIPPGVVKTVSANAAKGRYTDSDKIWFIKGRPQKWGGWEKLIEDQLTGMPRGVVSWNNQYGDRNIAVGTHSKLYTVTGDDTLTNRTPIRISGNLTDPFSTTDGSDEVDVAHTTHGLTQGDYVRFDGASAVGGITVDGEYTITSVTDANSYVVTHSSAATSTAGPGGGTVAYEYEITIGAESATVGLGWGAGTWGTGTWGTPRTSGINIEIRHWSLAPYGNDLLALPSGGTLYLWEEATDDQAEAVSNAPASARAMFVTAERFVMLLGTTTPMTVQWPDQDDITDWTPSAANTANSRKLQVGSKLIAGASVIDNVSLVWSDQGLYVFQYTGSDFVYEDRLVGENCGLVGPLAFCSVNGMAFWMSGHNFHIYSGGVDLIPNAEDIRAFVFNGINTAQITKTWCGYIEKRNAVIWGYCSAASIEPDRYVAVSLYDFSWTPGTLSRTCTASYRTSDASVLMVGDDGYIYEHETGTDADGSALEAYIAYGLYALDNGARNADIVGFVPDCETQSGDLSVELYTKDRPNSASNFDEATITLSEGEEIEDFRLNGRHFGFTIRSNVLSGHFRLGIPSIEVQSAGMRR